MYRLNSVKCGRNINPKVSSKVLIHRSMMKYGLEIENRKPSIASTQKNNKRCWFKDVVRPADNMICHKEERKIDKYDRLAWVGVKHLWSMKKGGNNIRDRRSPCKNE